MVWDVYKAYIRGYLTSAINDIKGSTSRDLERVETRKWMAENNYLSNSSDWLRAQTAVKEAHVEAVHRQVFFWRQNVFEHGDKYGRMLAYLSRDMQTSLVITEITTPTGSLVHCPCVILNCFVDYYRDLYSSHSTTIHQKARDFLAAIPLPTLTPDQCTFLDLPITCEEIQEAILKSLKASLKNGK